jgi:hypothetical protein
MVNDNAGNTPLPWLATPVWLMELYLKTLRKEGYTTIRLRELHDYLDKGTPIPQRSVIITFDDGYLDTWVNAYPLLEKYEMKAVVWVSSDSVVRSSLTRSNSEQAWRKDLGKPPLETLGYLSEGELQAMEQSGLVEVCVHCKTHTRVFTSDTIVDFQHPGANHYWLAWNRYPECRLAWLTNPVSQLISLGTPIYENGLATCSRQYFPSPDVEAKLVGYVEAEGGASFFLRKGWRKILWNQIRESAPENGYQGRYETDDELHKRLWIEIAEPKTYLEHLLGHSIHFLCWPGGGTSRLGLTLAKEAGYLATTVCSPPNQFGKRPDMINRMGVPAVRLPVLGRLLNGLLFRYSLGHTQFRFPYYQLWCVQRTIRGGPLFRSVVLRNSTF